MKRKLQEKETKRYNIAIFTWKFYLCCYRQQERVRQGKVSLEGERQGMESNDSDDNDVEWYRKEVGVAPDPGGWSLNTFNFYNNILFSRSNDQ